MPHDTVVTGIAGAGKTSYAIDVVENLIRQGADPMRIGFCSFSRAACAEAAERAEKVTGIPKGDLQKHGWFRTIHSAVLRSLGISTDAILDHDSESGRKWMDEHVFSARPARSDLLTKGTLAELVGDTLRLWDNHRSRLASFIVPKLPGLAPGSVVSGLEGSEQDGCFSSSSCFLNSSHNRGDTEGGDTLRAKKAGISTRKVRNGDTCPHPPCARVGTLSRGKTLGFRDLPRPHCLYRAKTFFLCRHQSFCENAFFQNGWAGGDKLDWSEFFPIFSLIGRDFKVATPSAFEGGDGWGQNHRFLDGCPREECENFRLGVATSNSSMQTTDHLFTEMVEAVTWLVGCSTLNSEQKCLIEVYERNKRIHGKIDFIDMLLMLAGVEYDENFSVRILDRKVATPDVPTLDFWLFDEYQDCSVLLDMCVERLSEGSQKRWFLGDRFQCIYDFNASEEFCVAHREGVANSRVLLNRTWRNPEPIVEWGEQVLCQDVQYVSREPVAEGDIGSVGVMEMGEFEALAPEMADRDVMVLSRAWFHLDRFKALLNGLGVPWRSLSEKHGSPWNSPVKLAYTLVMRDLVDGKKISEQDWRRVTEHLPVKFEGKELFVRGIKAKWKKMECGNVAEMGLADLGWWGASEWFVEFVLSGKWKKDVVLLLNEAIERYGLAAVRHPRVRLGTCHSAKGLEAEHVFCLAKSTPAAAESDEICLKYVTITRASRDYRLVVDSLDLARGAPLFWAAPKGAKFVKGFDFGERSTTAEEMCDVAEGSGDLVRQDRWVPDAEIRDPGFADLPVREAPGRGIEGSRREGDGAAGSRNEEDQEQWWDFPDDR